MQTQQETNQPKTATAKARDLVKAGRYKEALRIMKGFHRIFPKSDLRTFEIAYECMTGKEDFYRQLGFDPEDIKGAAKEAAIYWANGKG